MNAMGSFIKVDTSNPINSFVECWLCISDDRSLFIDRKLNVSPVVTPSTIDEYVEVGNCSSRIGKVKQPLDKTNMKRERAEMNEAIIEIV
jgi:hypothetical protein